MNHLTTRKDNSDKEPQKPSHWKLSNGNRQNSGYFVYFLEMSRNISIGIADWNFLLSVWVIQTDKTHGGQKTTCLSSSSHNIFHNIFQLLNQYGLVKSAWLRCFLKKQLPYQNDTFHVFLNYYALYVLVLTCTSTTQYNTNPQFGTFLWL